MNEINEKIIEKEPKEEPGLTKEERKKLEELKGLIGGLRPLEITQSLVKTLNKTETKGKTETKDETEAKREVYTEIKPGLWIFKHPKDLRTDLEFRLDSISAKNVVSKIIRNDDEIKKPEKKEGEGEGEGEGKKELKEFLIGKATPDDIITAVLGKKVTDQEKKEALQIITNDLLIDCWVVYDSSSEIIEKNKDWFYPSSLEDE